jgi:hypothetical protein
LWKKENGLLNFRVTYAPPRAHPAYAFRRCVCVASSS